ncbi:MAG: Flp family type IVb pilin [Endomicrobium sp.]|jgi:Flp pilus assembly pilin Flp|nr:Flp family type IVb pilin [Endomicrobium sp.]
MFRFLRNRRGQGMVEYILIIAVVVGIIFGVYKTMGGKVKDQFVKATTEIVNADVETN